MSAFYHPVLFLPFSLVDMAFLGVRKMIKYLLTLTFVLLSLPVYGTGMEEVNAFRASYGLPPFIEDAELTAFAQYKAEWQAAHDISLFNNCNGHEGPTVPGCTEGTGVAGPRSGWATCAMTASGSHVAGAGVAIGETGERYMCLVIASSRTTDAIHNPMVRRTSHMTPNAPKVARSKVAINPEPNGKFYTKPSSYPEWNHPIPQKWARNRQ